MVNAQTLDEVMASIDEQIFEDERRRAIEDPRPWFNLLHYPSRAAWRSSDHIFDTSSKGSDDISPLSQTQFNIIQHSERTNKQLKRTYRRVMEIHKLLAIKRERERRLAANIANSKQQQQSAAAAIDHMQADGDIEDGTGKMVGNWIEKKNETKKKKTAAQEAAATATLLCDDPSVALALSMGLSSSNFVGREGGGAEVLKNSGLTVKSAKNASKLAKAQDNASSSSSSSSSNNNSKRSNKENSVGYGPEQTLTHFRYRLGPNYSIVKRVLLEVQSLLGGKPPQGSKRKSFQPKRVLDFGCGVGSSSAAALDVFGVSRNSVNGSSTASAAGGAIEGIDWIHSIDASQPMREATEKVLKSVLENTPWTSDHMQMEEDETFNEEFEEYERFVKKIRGEPSKKQLERQRKRMEKWDQTWTRKENYRTRLTFGESIVDTSSFYSDLKVKNESRDDDRPALPWQKQLDEQRRKAIEKKARSTSQKGSFDLILCTYTLSELSNVPSSLSATALLWEKLAPGGVMVFVEPGTPDGFSTLRSVRSMLLECCPPPELKEKRRRAMMANLQKDDDDDDASDSEADKAASTPVDDDWPEECHVIAPCTHNGTCPMSRHQRNHVKRNTRFGRYEAATPNDEEGMDGEDIEEESDVVEGEEEQEDDEEGTDSKTLMSDWESLTEDERDDLKMMVGIEDMSDEEMQMMMKLVDSMDDSDDVYDDQEEDEEDSDDEHEEEDENKLYNVDNEYYNIDDKQTKGQRGPKSTMKKTDVFETSFCSFVHQFPGGTSRRRGEKFSYLVLQKRVPDDSRDKDDSMSSKDKDALDLDIVDMLSRSVYHSNVVKDEDKQKRREQKDFNSRGFDSDDKFRNDYFHTIYDNYHRERKHDNLQKAVEVEDSFIESTVDSLGLEMLYGDDRRKGWGRLIRAPLKRKGHVLIDYCSAGCGGNTNCSKNRRNGHFDDDDDDDAPDGTQGRITRQKVSRGWSARAAPGCHSAARKARWGGLWPDLSERVKLAERNDERQRLTDSNK